MKSDTFSINIPLIEDLQKKPKMFEISYIIKYVNLKRDTRSQSNTSNLAYI